MKRPALLLLSTLILVTVADAQVAERIAYQGVLTDAGTPLDGPHNLVIKLFDAASGGNQVWTRTYSGVQVEEGVFNVVLENGTPLLSEVAFDTLLWLQVKVDGQNLSPRTQLVTVPYAMSLRNLRVQPETTSGGPNMIGGWSGNTVAPGVSGATISGGGLDGVDLNNSISGDYGAIVGGVGNTAGFLSFAGGGQFNRASAKGSAIAGGSNNKATGVNSMIPGGQINRAAGQMSSAAGYNAKALHHGSYVWSDHSKGGFGDSLFTTGDHQYLIRAAGGVGIGTNAPLAPLHVTTVDLSLFTNAVSHEELLIEDTDAVLGLYSTGAATSGSAIVLAEHGGFGLVDKWVMWRETTTGTGNSSLHFAFGPSAAFNGGDTQLRVDIDGSVHADGSFIGGGADVAESFEVEGPVASYGPGDVLVISTRTDRTVERSSEPYSRLVAGVYATKPGMLLTDLNMDADDSDRIPMGVVGVIETKVSGENGPIARGDLLVTSSTEGHAMRGDYDQVGTGMAIGKALEPFDGVGTGRIEVLVTVR